MASALAAVATVLLDASAAVTNRALFGVKVKPPTAFAEVAYAVDVCGYVVLEEPWRVFAFDGGSVRPLRVFGGTPQEILLEAAFFHGVPVLFRLGLGHVAEQTATVRISLLLAAVVVLHDLLFVSPKALLVVDSGSEPEGGFYEGLEETAAATSAHIVFLLVSEFRLLRLKGKCAENA